MRDDPLASVGVEASRVRHRNGVLPLPSKCQKVVGTCHVAQGRVLHNLSVRQPLCHRSKPDAERLFPDCATSHELESVAFMESNDVSREVNQPGASVCSATHASGFAISLAGDVHAMNRGNATGLRNPRNLGNHESVVDKKLRIACAVA